MDQQEVILNPEQGEQYGRQLRTTLLTLQEEIKRFEDGEDITAEPIPCKNASIITSVVVDVAKAKKRFLSTKLFYGGGKDGRWWAITNTFYRGPVIQQG